MSDPLLRWKGCRHHNGGMTSLSYDVLTPHLSPHCRFRIQVGKLNRPEPDASWLGGEAERRRRATRTDQSQIIVILSSAA